MTILLKFPKLAFLIFIPFLASCLNKADSNLPEHINGVSIIYLECNPDSLEYIYKNFKSNHYIPVTVQSEGKKWGNVKMRVRGDSSRKLAKKSLKLKFPKGKSFLNGSRKVNLNAEWYDESYLSQTLSSHLMRVNGVYCFNTEHKAVYLNGSFYGIYVMIDNVDKHFLKQNGIKNPVSLYKATKDGASCNSVNETKKLWEQKIDDKNQEKKDLEKLIAEINNLKIEDAYTYYQNTFDYDNLITTIALNILTSNKSTYYHNYYLLNNYSNKKWYMLPWDMDKTIAKNLSKIHYAKSTWSEGYNSNLADNPIPEFIFTNEKMRNDLHSKINALCKTNFNNDYLDPIIDSLTNKLNPLIELDSTDHIKSKAQWLKRVNESKKFIKNRTDFVLNQINNYPSSFYVHQPHDNKIKWDNSMSVTPITYQIKFCSDYNFKKDSVYVFTTAQNEFEVNEQLPEGNYFYYVTAKNENGTTTGFRIKNQLNIK